MVVQKNVLASAGSYTVQVGAGGIAGTTGAGVGTRGFEGENSYITIPGTRIADGGGGNFHQGAGYAGGSGGGGGGNGSYAGGTGTGDSDYTDGIGNVEGNWGYNGGAGYGPTQIGGGGGGAGAVGGAGTSTNGGAGGAV